MAVLAGGAVRGGVIVPPGRGRREAGPRAARRDRSYSGPRSVHFRVEIGSCHGLCQGLVKAAARKTFIFDDGKGRRLCPTRTTGLRPWLRPRLFRMASLKVVRWRGCGGRRWRLV